MKKSKTSEAASNLSKRAQMVIRKKYTKDEISKMRSKAAIKRWKNKKSKTK